MAPSKIKAFQIACFLSTKGKKFQPCSLVLGKLLRKEIREGTGK
jgi:hypothetical protein